jgi:dihydrolipoamide dehydrogenase
MTSSSGLDEGDFDIVIAAVGWPGNIAHLNLASAGVETARGYVSVDATLRTSAPHIYAAGDITGRMMLVQCAGEDGLAAAENALRSDIQHEKPHQVVPHGGFTDPEYGSVGLTEPQARAKFDVVTAAIPYSHIDRAVIDSRPEGFCKLIVDRNTRRIVGAHVVGQQAVEIVQVAATAMQSRADIDDIARLEYAYPTFTSAIGLTARRILRKMGESTTVRHWGSADYSLAPEWEDMEP